MSLRDTAMRIAELLGELAGGRLIGVEVSEGNASLRFSIDGLIGIVEVLCGSGLRAGMVREAISGLLADFGIVLHVEECSRLENDELRFDAKVVVAGPLEGYIEEHLRDSGLSVGDDGWVRGVPLKEVARLVKSVSNSVREESWLSRYIEEIESLVQKFAEELASSDQSAALLQALREVLGGVGATSSSPELIYAQAALVLVLAAALCERARPGFIASELGKWRHDFRKLWILFNNLSKSSNLPLVEIAANIIKILPTNASRSATELLKLGTRLARGFNVLVGDVVGRIYSKVIGSLATRKGLATYFTEAPASHLLSYLAVTELLGFKLESSSGGSGQSLRNLSEVVVNVKAGDLACGSGTLVLATYSALLRAIATVAPYLKPEDVDLRSLSRRIVESGLYCLDVVDLSSRIASANIALASPWDLPKVHVYTIPFGEDEGEIYLGSLELIREIRDRSVLRRYVAGLPDLLDLVIMNPPFTRATGRGRKLWNEERSFLGFVGDVEVRRRLIRKLRRLRNCVRRSLIAEALSMRQELPQVVVDIVEGRGKDLRQYLNIGLAGIGLLFLYLAYQYVRPGGIIAFVLPRNLLSGVSWLLARTLLASRFHLRYVIVSSDSEGGYNFSSGADLSEVLLVARRVERHSDEEETVFVNLLRKPRTAAEALDLATRLSNMERPEHSASYVIRVVRRRELVENVDNWNRFVALPEPELVDLALELLGSGTIRVGSTVTKIPIVRLGDIVSTIGVNSPQFHENFSVVAKRTQYPSVYGGQERVRSAMVVEPNAYLEPRSDVGRRLFEKYSGRVLLPDRIWWDTAHYVAMLSTQPVLSNVFYVVRLKPVEGIPAEILEKVLILWLNTTWGILSVLVNRQETRGRWTRLKIGQWRLLPVLNVTSLNSTTLHEVAKAFDYLAATSRRMRRLPDQFDPEDPDPLRIEIDKVFLTAIEPSIKLSQLREYLLSLYTKLGKSMRTWIGLDAGHDIRTRRATCALDI